MRENWVQFLGWEDPLEEGRTTHSSILAWRISMERGTQWATVHGVAKSQTRMSTLTQTHRTHLQRSDWEWCKDILNPVVTQIPDFPLVCSWHYPSPTFLLKIREYSFLCSHILLLPTLVPWRIFPLQVSDPLLLLSSWTFNPLFSSSASFFPGVGHLLAPFQFWFSTNLWLSLRVHSGRSK